MANSSVSSNPLQPAEMSYASFWRRFLALVFDSVVIAVCGFILNQVINLVVLPSILLTHYPSSTLMFIVVALISGLVYRCLCFVMQDASERRKTFNEFGCKSKINTINAKFLNPDNISGRYFTKFISGGLIIVDFCCDGYWLQSALLISGLMLGSVFFFTSCAMVFLPEMLHWQTAFVPDLFASSQFMPVLIWLYFAVMESSEKQATLGKLICGLRVTTMEGKRLTFQQATGRYFAKFISALIFMAGFIMAAFNNRKQGLHDILAKTLVLKASDV